MVHMDKCSKCVRWSLFAFNCLVWLGGSVMLGLGIWVTTQDTEYKHLAGNLYVAIGYIVISAFVFIIGFLGACAILLMKQNLLKVYFSLMLVLLTVELGVAVYLYLEKDKINDHIGANWNETSDEARIIIQQQFECCGLKPLNLEHESSFHKSCYVDNDKEKERLKDCYTHLMDWIKRNHIILATCSVIVAALQIFILGGTCRLISEIESGDRSVKRTRVVPINVKPHSQTQENTQRQSAGQTSIEMKSQQAGAGKNPREDSDEFEEEPRSTIARKNWAKLNPKYNSVLSLLEK